QCPSRCSRELREGPCATGSGRSRRAVDRRGRDLASAGGAELVGTQCLRDLCGATGAEQWEELAHDLRGLGPRQLRVPRRRVGRRLQGYTHLGTNQGGDAADGVTVGRRVAQAGEPTSVDVDRAPLLRDPREPDQVFAAGGAVGYYLHELVSLVP